MILQPEYSQTTEIPENKYRSHRICSALTSLDNLSLSGTIRFFRSPCGSLESKSRAFRRNPFGIPLTRSKPRGSPDYKSGAIKEFTATADKLILPIKQRLRLVMSRSFCFILSDGTHHPDNTAYSEGCDVSHHYSGPYRSSGENRNYDAEKSTYH